ncbi:hypothetical protein ACLQ2Q_12335 [Microbacterium sp. DT81.1]|uniref:hypothetical protein n=1 Tax=Microbacterium sp. DT81.1 TaxID=3393413 RepID=UPI003CF0AA58
MTSTFWRDTTGRTWAHLSEIRDEARLRGSTNWREWDPVNGSALGRNDALIVIGLDRREIAADLPPRLDVGATNAGDVIIVFGHKSGKTVGTGLVEVVIVPSSHPLCRPGAARPRSLEEIARTTGSILTMDDLKGILENWHR